MHAMRKVEARMCRLPKRIRDHPSGPDQVYRPPNEQSSESVSFYPLDLDRDRGSHHLHAAERATTVTVAESSSVSYATTNAQPYPDAHSPARTTRHLLFCLELSLRAAGPDTPWFYGLPCALD